MYSGAITRSAVLIRKMLHLKRTRAMNSHTRHIRDAKSSRAAEILYCYA